ncbi:MAG: hypothetical protein RIC18_16145 [Hoeflea sp.]|uniref:hypothetical protein n=1 Tax=Hoeflea sp. TaxID=1940281 RepID=UPI0032ECDFC6
MSLSGNRKSKTARVAMPAAGAMIFTAIAVAGLSLRIDGEVSFLLTALASLCSALVTVPVVALILAQIEKCELANDDLVAVRRELSIIRQEIELASSQSESLDLVADRGAVTGAVDVAAVRVPAQVAA